MKKGAFVILLVFILSLSIVSAADLQVSKPIQVTDNPYYERGQSLIFDGTNYWLFYARSDSVIETYETGNPDTNDYRIYYQKATNIEDLANSPSFLLDGSKNLNLYLGETAATVYYDKVWVFGSHDPDGVNSAVECDIYGWYTSDGGITWNEVGPIVSGIPDGSAHLAATSYSDELWLAYVGWNTITSTNPEANVWSSAKSVGGPATGGNGDFYLDSEVLYFAIAQSSNLALNRYDIPSSSWNLQDSLNNPDSKWDATLLEIDEDFGFFYAPWSGGKQWIEAIVGPDLANVLTVGIVKTISEAQYGTNVWINMWPTGFSDDVNDKYLFYTSEYNPNNTNSEIAGNIWFLNMDWDLNQDHFESFQEALDAAGPGDTITLGTGTYEGGIIIDKSLTITQGSRPVVDCGGSGNGFIVNAADVTIDGIEIINCDNGIEVNDVNFTSINNSIHNNVIGILVNNGAGTALINGNSIFNNSNLGISNLGINVLNAEENWWGHYTGPYKASGNPSGQGNPVSNNVDYDPWLCEEIESTWLTVGGICDFDGDTYAPITHGGTDCDDTDPDIFVGNPEVCDDKDNDCNAGTLDGSGEAAPLNSNQEGVCVSSVQTCSGSWQEDYSGVANYESPELTCDALDNNCDASVDEGTKSTFYEDFDTDTFGNLTSYQNACVMPVGYVVDSTDCDDTDGNVFPGATEFCNGIDDNCDTFIDEGFLDTDLDGEADCVDLDDDNDTILDVNDNCPLTPNLDQINTDEFLPNGDNLGDACDDDDDADGIPDVDDPRPLIPNEGPVVEYVAPASHTWFKEDFEVSFSDSDADVSEFMADTFTCEYRVMQKRAAAAEQWQESLEWTPRENQGTILVLVPNQCQFEGYDYCKVESRCTDEWNLTGPMADRFFSIDMTGPRIHDVLPLNIIGDVTPRIEAHWNDRGSGLDLSSAVIELDSVEINVNLYEDRFTFDASSDLTEGIHLVEVSISDNLGTESTFDWTFEIDLTFPSLEIISPEPDVYDTRRIDLDINANEQLREIRMSKDGGSFRRICRNCDLYMRSLFFTDGEHTLEFEGEDYAGNIDEKEVTFIVDSKPPRIYDFWPEDGEIVHGTEFGVRYTEQENLDYVKLFWGVNDSWNEEELGCDTGRNEICTIELNLSQYDGNEIHYYFELKDDINLVTTPIVILTVDDSDPFLVINEPSFDIQESRRVLFDLDVDEPVTLSYSIDGTRFRTLCRDCTEYYGYKTFRDGEYDIWIKAEDEIGNDVEELKEFEIDSKKPRIYSTLPRTKYVDDDKFTVFYSEDNLDHVILHLGDVEYPGICPEGQRQECVIEGEIELFDGEEVDYYFEILDVFGNIINSRPRTIIPDTEDPEITIVSPEENETYFSLVRFDIELDEKVKKLWYEDLDTGYTRSLCTNCDSYYRLKRFRSGIYSLKFMAEDFVGHTNDLDVGFEVI